MWGLTEFQEQYILSILKPFQEEKLDPDEIETEAFHYQYRALSQPRIFNDVIILRLFLVFLRLLLCVERRCPQTQPYLAKNSIMVKVDTRPPRTIR
jgi:hypothetical protein